VSHPLPTSESEIDAFLAAFEDATLPKERWTHAAHILGGACYVHRLGEAAALDHMRLCVRRFNEAVGGQNTATAGYHETVTAFWIKLLHAFLASQQPIARAEFATLAVTQFASRQNIYRHFYDFDIVASTEARAQWLPPTLKAITPTSLHALQEDSPQ
jgi:hypothetical protein